MLRIRYGTVMQLPDTQVKLESRDMSLTCAGGTMPYCKPIS